MSLTVAGYPLDTQRGCKRIAFKVFVDQRHFNPAGQRLGLRVNLSTANNPDIACGMALRQRILQAARSIRTFRLPVGLPRDNYVGTPWQWAKFWRY